MQFLWIQLFTSGSIYLLMFLFYCYHTMVRQKPSTPFQVLLAYLICQFVALPISLGVYAYGQLIQ